jgi:hypothetical protein
MADAGSSRMTKGADVADRLDDAAEAGLITRDQAARLRDFLGDGASVTAAAAQAPATLAAPAPRFDLAHMLWYAGALLIMGAMGSFSTLAFGAWGPHALLITAIVYAICFTLAGHHLWHRKGLRVPGGLLIAVAVSMVPLAIWSFQDLMGWWAGFDKPGAYRDFYVWVKGGFLPMEIATILACLVALRFYRFPFLLFIAAICIWFMSMDVADWLKGDGRMDWDLRRNVSLAFGLVMIPTAWWVDLKFRDADYGFWLHMVAAVTFWGGLTFQDSSNELGKFLYFLICLGLLGLAVFLKRRVYAVFGAIGMLIYLGHLTGKVFKDWLTFPFVLTLIGIGVIWLGIKWQKNSALIEARIVGWMPAALARLRPGERG